MNIINLTQHTATNEQATNGVVEPNDKKAVQSLLTFNNLPTRAEIAERATALAKIAQGHGATHAMIGGAGYLMPALENALKETGITPLHAFSVRESVEEIADDGSVVKKNVFRHVGFVGLP